MASISQAFVSAILHGKPLNPSRYSRRRILCVASFPRHSPLFSRKCGALSRRHSLRVRSALQQDPSRAGDDEKKRQSPGKSPILRPIQLALHIISAAAALVVTIEAFRAMERLQRAIPGARKKKRLKAMTLEERQAWTRNLPAVEENIPCDEVINPGYRVKHVIRHPGMKLRQMPAEVLVVMGDDRVYKTVLPELTGSEDFWRKWDEMKLNKVVTEAYTPPPPPVEIPDWAMKGPSLTFLRGFEDRIKRVTSSRKGIDPVTNLKTRVKELQRENAVRKKEAEIRKERMEMAMEQRLYEEQVSSKESRKLQREKREEWNMYWTNAANNEGLRFALGVFFFWLFYVTVVVGIKKRRRDYEDRIKIRRQEDLERKEARELEKSLEKAARARENEQQENEEENDQLKLGLRFMKSGAKMRQGRAGRSGKYADGEADVKFSDVAGLGNIRVELEEIVDFFTHAEKFRRRGCRIPTGVLLCGDPGVGKTLLAKAVAGEAGVNFFAISASQFVEIYVGVGASRVRSLYSEANQNAPAVVFIDELDAVGRMRGLSEGSGGQERDATLNQLLTCLDGFEGNGQVITIAATNRPDILDPALVRPGRFDRKIYIPKPSLQGRIEILQVHARSKPMAEGIDYFAVAQMTMGMVGAQLAHVVDVGALTALRDGRTEVTTDDLLEAAQNEEGGQPDLHIRSDRVKNILALQEASMAAMAANCPEMKDIELISIIPRMGEEKGFVRFKADQIKFGSLQSISRQSLLDHITVQLAPRAADELWNGPDKMSTVFSDNVDIARKAARLFVKSGHSDREDLYGLNGCIHKDPSKWDWDSEAQNIINSCYSRALEYLDRNRELVNALVNRLVEKGNVWKPEFTQLVEQFARLDPPRPDALEVRNKNREAFEEEMMRSRRTSKPVTPPPELKSAR